MGERNLPASTSFGSTALQWPAPLRAHGIARDRLLILVVLGQPDLRRTATALARRFRSRRDVATLLGTYPTPPPNAQPTFAARLAADGSLFEIATNLSELSNDLIIRRTLGGESDIVYDESDNPLVKLHISALVTGP
jgi:hypothetical protein